MEKQEKNRHLYSKIVLLGSNCRVGVTFTSVLLVAYLNQSKMANALYVERNTSDFIRKMADWSGFFRKEDGVYRYGEFKGIPMYGAGVRFEIPPQTLCVEDYGCDMENFFEELKTADKDEDGSCLVIFLIENSCWEWETAFQKSVRLKNVLEQSVLQGRHMELKLMLNGVLPQEVKKFERFFQCHVITMPWEPNPYQITAAKKRTMKLLLQKGGDKDFCRL